MGTKPNVREVKINPRKSQPMLVSLKYNFVFFSNPKCATTSIENAIKKYCEISLNSVNIGGKHISPHKFKKSWGPFLRRQYPKSSSYQKICTCRHPISKLISWYDYRCRKKLLASKRKDKYLGDIPFEEWCLNEMKQTNTGFFLNKDFKSEVDLAIPITSLDVLEKHFCTIIGKPIRFKQLNSSSNNATKKADPQDRFKFVASNLNYASTEFIKRIDYFEQLENVFKTEDISSIPDLILRIKDINV